MGIKLKFPKFPDDKENWSVETNKDILDLYVTWYEKYKEIIQYISGIATGVFFFSITFLLSDFVNKNLNKSITFQDFSLFLTGIAIIFFAVVCSFVCILSTYNWLRSIIEKVKESSEIKYNDLIKDRIYSDKSFKSSKNTRVWGNISLYSGWAAGILLVIGLGIYGLGIRHLLSIIIERANM